MRLILSLILVAGCTSPQKVAPTIEPDTAQLEIDSLQTQIASLDALIENTRTHLEGFSLADMAKRDLALTGAEAEIETYKIQRQKLEARLAEIQAAEPFPEETITE